MRNLAIWLALCHAASAGAQTSPAPAAPPQVQPASGATDIVVVGDRSPRGIGRQPASEYVRNVSQLPVSGQYARWHDPICPHVLGLEAPTATFVEDRIARIAVDAGLRPGAPGCRANIVILFTPDGDLELRALERRRIAFPRSVSSAERRRIRAARQPVRWWTETDLEGSDGEQLSTTPSVGISGIADLALPVDERARWTSSYTSSVIATKVRSTIPSAVGIVDVTLSSGRTLSSIADHLGFLILGRARAATGIAASTIARLFDPSCPDCTTLSAADRAYLKALYRTPANRSASTTRAELTDMVASGD